MAEETQGIGNKWLLIIALVLGLGVVVIYNVHIRAIRSEHKGKAVEVIVVTRDLRAGEKITAKHIDVEQIPRGEEKAFGKVLKWKDRNFVLARGGRRVNRDVRKGEYMLWDYVTGSGATRASGKLGDGMVAIPIEFDTAQSLGDILSVGDTVNLKGVFRLRDGQYRTHRIISAVRVMNVGGRGADARAGAARGMKNYRKITIEVSPEVSLKLSNLMTHMYGRIQLELNQAAMRRGADAGKINPQLEAFAARARPAQSARGERVRSTAQPGGEN